MFVQPLLSRTNGLLFVLLLADLIAASAAPLPTALSDVPVYSANNVPANLMLALSVEYPTGVVAAYTDSDIPLVYADSAGNPQTLPCGGLVAQPNTTSSGVGVCYFPQMKYLGYFDYDKCYDYDSANRYFKPVSIATSHVCSGHWSGNMLNWASMKALDEFRQVLTGGYRSTDDIGLTVLERARDSAQGGLLIPFKKLDAADNVAPLSVVGDSVLASAATLYLRSNAGETELTNCTDPAAGRSCSVTDRGIFLQIADNVCFLAGSSNKVCTNSRANHMRQYYVRVQVCAPGMLEKNCNAAHARTDYPGAGTYSKPEGLIQQNYQRIRVGAAAYEHFDGSLQPNGAVRALLRDNGPSAYNGLGTRLPNANAEWDAVSGIFADNPDRADALASWTTGTIRKSGAINYLNQFGKVEDGYTVADTLSELYYVALAYLKHHPLESSYQPGGGNPPVSSVEADGFPVLLKDLNDPIQYTCQGNAIVTFGDSHTWDDTAVPMSKRRSTPVADNHNPLAVLPASGSDPGLDTGLWLKALGDLPLVETTPAVTMNSSARGDISQTTVVGNITPTSTYNIAGMAYYAHTQNMRPDLTVGKSAGDSKVTIDTYTVDVMEPGAFDGSSGQPTYNPSQLAEGAGPNQYWLAAKYGGFTVDDAQCAATASGGAPCITIAGVKVPTPQNFLAWHTNTSTAADKNLRPDNYFPGNRPDLIQSGLSTIFTQVVSKRVLSGSAPGVASSRVLATANTAYHATNGVPVYQTGYTAGVWSGDITGMLDRFDPVTGNVSILSAWHAQAQTDALTSPITTTSPPIAQPWDSVRRVVTYDPGIHRGIPFRYSSLSGTQQSYFPGDSNRASPLLDYLRGDRSNEGTRYRVRQHTLGDIVDSGAVVVQGALSPNYNDGANRGYSAFAASVAAREPVVFAGANDGMLHAFAAGFSSAAPSRSNPFVDVYGNALGGTELYAYVPSFVLRGPSGTPAVDGLAALANLNGVTPNPFAHHFYVDATPQVADVDFAWTCNTSGVACAAGASPQWHSLLVGGVGKGGKGIYALDITTPPSPLTTSPDPRRESSIAANVLWEFTDADLGYTFSRPVVAKTRMYGWVVLLTSGYDNTGPGYLYVLNARTGALLDKLKTSIGTLSLPSGLGSPTPFTTDNADGTIEQVYAGDLLGNVWRFDLSGTDKYPAPTLLAILQARDGSAQPVTTAPRIEVDVDSSGLGTRRWVFVGTGRFLDLSDLSTAQPQTMYALRDGSATVLRTDGLPLTRSALLADTNLAAGVTLGDKDAGWYYDLTNIAPGGATERIVVDPDAVSGLPIVAWASLVPTSDPCQFAGQQYAVNFSSGRSVLQNAAGASIPYLAFAQGLTSSQIVQLPPTAGAPTKYAILGQPLSGTPVLSLLDAPGLVGSLGRANWREVLD